MVQHRGANATLVNTVEMHLPISNILEDLNHCVEVLPAIELPKAPQQYKRPAASTVAQKGKQKEVAQPMDVDMGQY
jgi:hypothetical protein